MCRQISPSCSNTIASSIRRPCWRKMASASSSPSRALTASPTCRRTSARVDNVAAMSTGLPMPRRSCEAGLQHPRRFPIVALAAGERGADIERMGMGDVRTLDGRQGERGAHIAATLGRVTAQDPEAHQRDLHLDRDDRVASPPKRKRDGGAHVVVLGFEAPGPFGLLGSLQAAIAGLRQHEEVVAVPRRRRRQLLALVQILARELADRLQLPVARAPVSASSAITSDLSTSDVSRSSTSSGASGSAPQTASAAARSKPPAKTLEPVEQHLLVLRQQVVRPGHQRAQRLLALQQHATAAGEQLEPICAAAC